MGKHDGNSMNMKRMRGRNHRSGGGGAVEDRAVPIRHHSGGGVPLNRNHVFDSNGPEIRIRGTAQQLFEKYLQLGRDATSSGDRVTAEAFFQHAEHYFRILNAMNQAQQQGQPNGQAASNNIRRATSAAITSKARVTRATTTAEDRGASAIGPAHAGLGDQPEASRNPHRRCPAGAERQARVKPG